MLQGYQMALHLHVIVFVNFRYNLHEIVDVLQIGRKLEHNLLLLGC